MGIIFQSAAYGHSVFLASFIVEVVFFPLYVFDIFAENQLAVEARAYFWILCSGLPICESLVRYCFGYCCSAELFWNQVLWCCQLCFFGYLESFMFPSNFRFFSSSVMNVIGILIYNVLNLCHFDSMTIWVVENLIKLFRLILNLWPSCLSLLRHWDYIHVLLHLTYKGILNPVIGLLHALRW